MCGRGMHGGGVHGRGCEWQGGMSAGEMATEAGRYASYWNAFLLYYCFRLYAIN